MHVQKLLRQADEVVYCFDGDTAGRRAAWRALENSLAQLQDGKQVRFLFLPAEDDPDSFVRAHGKEAFEKLLDAAPAAVGVPASHELTRASTCARAEGRARFLQEAKPLVKQIAAPMLSLMLRKQIAELAGVSQAELDRSFEIKAAGAQRRRPSGANAVKPSLGAGVGRNARVRSRLLAALADRWPPVAETVEPRVERTAAVREPGICSRTLLELCWPTRTMQAAVSEHFRGGELERLSAVSSETVDACKWEALDQRGTAGRVRRCMGRNCRQRWRNEGGARCLPEKSRRHELHSRGKGE